MARISTGQTFGETGRTTAARLLGGAQQTGTPGVLGQMQINTPGLQPQAAPVETFQQTGVPTVSGPPKVFAPPETPAPSQDLANLAKSLGGFSATLEQFGQSYQQFQKAKEKQAEQAGAAIAAEATQYGQFGSFGELLKTVEKRSATDPAAAAYLQRLKSLDPRTLPYAVANIQDSAVKFNLATVRERMNQTRALPDGTPLNEVDPADPRFSQLMTSMLLPGDMAVSPRVFQNNQAALYSMYGSLGSDQAKRYGDYKTERARAGFARANDAQIASLASGLTNSNDFAVNVSGNLNELWGNSGLTTQDYQKEKELLLNNLADSARAYAAGDIGKLTTLGPKLINAVAKLTAGPNNEPFLDQVGGQRALSDFYRRLMQGVASDRELEQRFESFVSEDQADKDVTETMTQQVLSNPSAFQKQSDLLLKRGPQLFPGEPDKQLAYQSRVQKQLDNLQRAYVQPIQDKEDLALWSRMANDPQSMSVEQVVDMRNRGLISKGAATQALSSLQTMNREDNKANYQTLRQAQQDLKARLELQFKRGESEGGATFTPNEAKQLFGALGALYRRGDDLIKTNPGKDLTQQIGDLYSKAVISGMTPAKAPNKPPAIKRETLLLQLNNVDQGLKLDPGTRDQIKRSGMKPSQYFRQQMEGQGLKLDPSTEQKLQELDKSDLVSSVGGGGGGLAMVPTDRYGALASRLANQFASALGNSLVPPAAAAQPVIATASGGGGRGGGGRNSTIGQRSAIVKAAQQLGIRPVDLAAVISLETGGTYAKDIRGGEGGNYQGLIQFGPTERRTYGYRSNMNFEQQVLGPVVRYLKARGVKPGHGVKEIYAAILTGNVANIAQGGLDWKDSNGTSVRKALPSLTKGGHYQNAIRFLRGS